jgi:hypothetical protein
MSVAAPIPSHNASLETNKADRVARTYWSKSVFVEGLNDTLAHDGQGTAATIQSLTDGSPNPPFRDTVLLDIGVFDAIQADTDAARENRLVVVATGRINAKTVGERNGCGFAHGENDTRSTERTNHSLGLVEIVTFIAGVSERPGRMRLPW